MNVQIILKWKWNLDEESRISNEDEFKIVSVFDDYQYAQLVLDELQNSAFLREEKVFYWIETHNVNKIGKSKLIENNNG
jgi:hypothetical protein